MKFYFASRMHHASAHRFVQFKLNVIPSPILIIASIDSLFHCININVLHWKIDQKNCIIHHWIKVKQHFLCQIKQRKTKQRNSQWQFICNSIFWFSLCLVWSHFTSNKKRILNWVIQTDDSIKLMVFKSNSKIPLLKSWYKKFNGFYWPQKVTANCLSICQ